MSDSQPRPSAPAKPATADRLWSPTAEQIRAANLTAFRGYVGQRWGMDLPDYRALHEWSTRRPDQFWASVWDYCQVVGDWDHRTVVESFDRMPGARWFPGARLNFAENLLRCRDDRPAVIFGNEQGQRQTISFRELARQVARCAAGLRRLGVRPGDRVAGYLPNLPETVVAMLAATSLGAVWSSTSPDFGLAGVVDRFGQIEPKILITADGYVYGGKRFDCLDRVQDVCRQIGSIEHVVVVPYLEQPVLDGLPGALTWQDLLESETADGPFFERFDFDRPLYVLYSSGTTGPPKCIVHSAGGILVQHLKEHVLHTDLKPTDRFFYFTTCGWMMWNWLVSGLAVGATVVLYDGSPLAPTPQVLFDLIDREHLTIFGTSPRFLTAVQKAGLAPRQTHDLASLRAILSTGSPLNGENFDYVYSSIKSDVRLSSISGGTDLCGCFAAGNATAPVYRGELQCRALGMNVLVYDKDGRPTSGHKGELVCASPFPSMPLGFFNDADGSRYRQAYFERFPGVWCHGDWAEITRHDGLVIYGRSDAVLNPGGVRIGTAEIYRQVERLPEVVESVVIGQPWQGDVRVVLFVKLRDGLILGEGLVEQIKQQIRSNATPRHVPARIVQVADIPRTRSGKVVELAVRDVVQGIPVRNIEALANPNALEQFRDRAELAD
ncbi:MAG TPA: acetoacetate--CoA ligase [Pirellulales bacterium]|nr:acetoacetate--CoA ligase [Pirellulales bacterium]